MKCLSTGSILLKGTDGLHLNTTTDALDLEEGVNNLSSEVLLQASVHQYYPEPLLSNFEQQVAELGIDEVLNQRKRTNVDAKVQGAKEGLLDFAKGLWNSVVDIGDIVLTGHNDEEMRRTYSILNHGKEIAPLEEHARLWITGGKHPSSNTTSLQEWLPMCYKLTVESKVQS